MAHAVVVDDPEDERLTAYVGLTDAELRRLGEVFICEGMLVIRRAIARGIRLRSLLLTPGNWRALEDELAALDVTAYVADQSVMNAVTGFNIHRGAVAAAVRPDPPELGSLLAGHDTIAVLEGMNDHENLGALFRNAAAFSVGAVLLDHSTADPLYRRAVRVSVGYAFAVPHRRLEQWPDDLTDVREAGFEVVALTPDPDAEPISSLDRPRRVALLLGAEGPGLTSAALPPPIVASASRWRPVSTRSTWPRRPPSPSTDGSPAERGKLVRWSCAR